MKMSVQSESTEGFKDLNISDSLLQCHTAEDSGTQEKLEQKNPSYVFTPATF